MQRHIDWETEKSSLNIKVILNKAYIMIKWVGFFGFVDA